MAFFAVSKQVVWSLRSSVLQILTPMLRTVEPQTLVPVNVHGLQQCHRLCTVCTNDQQTWKAFVEGNFP